MSAMLKILSLVSCACAAVYVSPEISKFDFSEAEQFDEFMKNPDKYEMWFDCITYQINCENVEVSIEGGKDRRQLRNEIHDFGLAYGFSKSSGRKQNLVSGGHRHLPTNISKLIMFAVLLPFMMELSVV